MTGGVHGKVEGKNVLIGQRPLLADRNVQNLAQLDERADELAKQGRTVVFVSSVVGNALRLRTMRLT